MTGARSLPAVEPHQERFDTPGVPFVFVVPSLDVVVVATGGDYEAELEGAVKFVREMLRDALLGLALEETPALLVRTNSVAALEVWSQT
ncbi:MAG: hypothetical protein V1750_06650 [Acidobacteriota bacterium]